jgi:hypothetical protein
MTAGHATTGRADADQGAVLFARFAHPPNELGYCGPDATGELLERADARVSDPDLRRLASAFDGAWPYLELIAHAHGLADPLDARVVEGYWLGGPMLDGVTMPQVGTSLERRFRPRLGPDWHRLDAVIQHRPRPHHDFHVFCVYPWVGLLRSGATDHALHVLDRCRIRGARVEALDGSTALVSSRPLVWDGRGLGLGAPRIERVEVSEDGRSLAGSLQPGDVVACHWGWVCHRLTAGQARALRSETATQLDFVNRLAVPPPAAVLR